MTSSRTAAARQNCCPICGFAARIWHGGRQVCRKTQVRQTALQAVGPAEEERRAEAVFVNDEPFPDFMPCMIPNADIYNEERDLTKMNPKKRRTMLFRKLVMAGGALETVLEESSESKNIRLMEDFHKRVEIATEQADKTAEEGLRWIWRRVRAEAKREGVSPSMRLLDRLLGLLHPSAGGTAKERYHSAWGLLLEAFTGTVSSMNLLVWAIDMSPPSDDLAPPKELQELVHKSAFIAEVVQ